jgi:hypothetical protein
MAGTKATVRAMISIDGSTLAPFVTGTDKETQQQYGPLIFYCVAQWQPFRAYM